MVHLSQAQGEFVLPDQVPEHVVFISGGSGITPVMSMLRSLQRRTHRGRVTFIHYAQSPEHQIFAAELDEIRRSGHGIDMHLLHPELGDPNLSPAFLERLLPGYRDLPTWACGPAPLIEGVRAAYDASEALRVEYFQPPRTSGTSARTVRPRVTSPSRGPARRRPTPAQRSWSRPRRSGSTPSSAAGWASASPARR